jgi:outer membrane protein TolC
MKRLVFFLMFFLISSPQAQSRQTLDMPSFLEQVRSQNTGFQGAALSSESAEVRSSESNLLLTPTLYSTFQFTSDSRLLPVNFLPYKSINSQTYSLGVSKLTSFGLQAKFHYDVYSQSYIFPNGLSFQQILSATNSGGGSSSFLSLFSPTYVNASPVLELTQSLWSNGFGKSTRATRDMLEAQALAEHYTTRFQARSLLTQAEVTYWKLAACRQATRIQSEALDRAKKIYAWNQRRAQLHLTDPSDVIQSEALVKMRELNLVSAENAEKLASREFNSARNIESEQVPEELSELKPELLRRISIPERLAFRDDVKAADQAAKVQSARAIVNAEKNSPTLDVFGNLTLNGQPAIVSQGGQFEGMNAYSSLGPSFRDSWTLNRPTYTVGVRFSAPLDFSLISQNREAWIKDKTAAELTYSRKLLEQDQAWKDLTDKLKESQNRFQLALQLEEIQKRKLQAEQDRVKRGRSTTYQVLLFEQDYLLSQLGRMDTQTQILSIIAQMKLFGEKI